MNLQFEGMLTSTAKKGFSPYTDRNLVSIFILTFAMSLGMNSINAIWPLYIISLGATVFEASYVITLSGIVGTILRSPSGVVSDRIGRRRIIIASILLASIAPILYTQATDWNQLILWGSVYSMAFAFFMPTRNAWIADLVRPEDRAAAYSFLFMAFPLGGIIGPTLGGFIADEMGWATLFILATTIHGLCLVPMMTTREATSIEDRREGQLDAQLQIGRAKTFPLLVLLMFLFGFGFGTVNNVIPIYLTERFQTTKTGVGLFTSIGFGVTATLAQISGPRLAKKLGEGSLILYCCSILPLTFVLWPFSTAYMQLLLLRMAATAAWTTTWSSTTSILMEAAPPTRRGLYAGISQTSIMLGFTLGPTLAGILWEEIGYNAPLYASSLIFAFSVPTAALLRRSWQTAKVQTESQA